MAKKSLINKSKKKPKFQVRAYNRCERCGRPRAYIRKFKLCRICFRELGQQWTDPRRYQSQLVETDLVHGLNEVKLCFKSIDLIFS